MNIAQALQRASVEIGGNSPRLDGELLLAHVLARPRTFLFGWPEHELSAEQEAKFGALLARRKQGEPIAYILQVREFWSLALAVDESTLIPRPDTELLVELALAKLERGSKRVLDLGTGTGAIALALAKELPQIDVLGVDRVEAAVALAEGNRRRLGITNARFLLSNWFENVEGLFDLIVSNPPYIAAEDPHLAEGDVRFEPASALVSGTDGLDDIRAIVGSAPRFLRPGGWLLLEHGWQQSDSVSSLLQAGGFTQVASVEDLAGHPRVTGGCWPLRSG